MSFFKQALNNISPFSDSNFSLLESICFQKTINNGDFVLKQDVIGKYIYFINKGMVRIYYLKDGRDITEWFAYENQFCFSINSYFNEVPSKLVIQCIEDCEIKFIPKQELESLANKNLEISKFYRQLIAGSLIFSQIRMESIQFETALQRYEELINSNPEIIKRAPLKYIASFLGISFETLSRIRNQVH